MATLKTYNDFKEKEGYFNVEIIDSKIKFDKLYDSIKQFPKSIWRGSTESKYKIYSSLQRYWIENDLKNDSEEIIKYLKHIYEFSLKWNSNFLIKYYKNYGIDTGSFFASFSILRHHGTPTPIIDWTRNPKIGLFFGVRNSKIKSSDNVIDNYFSLIELREGHPANQFDYKKMLLEAWSQQEEGLREINQATKESDPNFINKFSQAYLLDIDIFLKDMMFQQYSVIKIQDVDGDEMKFATNNNYNITNQEGLFIFFLDSIFPMEEIFIRKTAQYGDNSKASQVQINSTIKKQQQDFISYEIHKNLKEYVLKKLEDDGINDRYVFPDLKELANEALNSYLKS